MDEDQQVLNLPPASEILPQSVLEDVLDKDSDEGGSDNYTEDQGILDEEEDEQNMSEKNDIVPAITDSNKDQAHDQSNPPIQKMQTRGFFVSGPQVASDGSNSSDFMNSYGEALEDDEYKSDGFDEVEDGIDALNEEESNLR